MGAARLRSNQCVNCQKQRSETKRKAKPKIDYKRGEENNEFQALCDFSALKVEIVTSH
jgi:hypothetical protein